MKKVENTQIKGSENMKYTLDNPYYNIKVDKNTKIHISLGNIKIGRMFNFNLLPGEKPASVTTKGILTNISGTCKGCCDDCEDGGCYAIKSLKAHHNVIIKAWGENTLLVRKYLKNSISQIKDFLNEELLKEANPKHKKIRTLRLHSTGEFDSYKYFVACMDLAKETPEFKIYCYTKRFNYVIKYLRINKEIPDNMVINLSKWHHNIDKYLKIFEKENLSIKNIRIFAYDDGTEPELNNWHHCPAINKQGDETGVTCDKCGACYRANNNSTAMERTAVYAH